MAYIAPDIKDRIAVGDNKYRIETLPDGRVDITSAPDSVTEPGTDVNKEMLQEAFDTIEGHDTAINTTIPENIATSPLTNAHGIENINVTTAGFSQGDNTTDGGKTYTNWYCDITVPYKRFLMFVPSSVSTSWDGASQHGVEHPLNSVYFVDLNTLSAMKISRGEEDEDIGAITSKIPLIDRYSGTSFEDSTATATVSIEFIANGLRFHAQGWNLTFLSFSASNIKIIQI